MNKTWPTLRDLSVISLHIFQHESIRKKLLYNDLIFKRLNYERRPTFQKLLLNMVKARLYIDQICGVHVTLIL